MAEQTAVEWLIKRYHDYGTLYYEDMTKAKEMEKEQQNQSHVEGYRKGMNDANEYLKQEFFKFYK
jgi:hypothetical protein